MSAISRIRRTPENFAKSEPRYYLCDKMHITLLTVGKTDIPWVREGLEMYVSRLGHYVPFSLKEIPELKAFPHWGASRSSSARGN